VHEAADRDERHRAHIVVTGLPHVYRITFKRFVTAARSLPMSSEAAGIVGGRGLYGLL
jgi:hypothetical protein